MIEATRKGGLFQSHFIPPSGDRSLSSMGSMVMVMGPMVMGSMVVVMVLGSPQPQGSPGSETSSSQSSSSSGSSDQSSLWTTSESRSLSSDESSPDSAPPSPQRPTPKYSYSGLLGFYRDEGWPDEEADDGELRPKLLKDLVGDIADPLYMGTWHRPLAADPNVVQVKHVPTATDGVYPPRGVFSVQVPPSLRHISLDNGEGAYWCIQWLGEELGCKIIPGYYVPRFLQCDYESLLKVYGRCTHMGTPPICLQSAPLDYPNEEIPLNPFIFHLVDPYTSVSQPTNLSGLVLDTEPVTYPVILPNTLRGALFDRWPLAEPVVHNWNRMYRWTSRQKRARLE